MKKFLIVLFLLAFLATGCSLVNAPFFEGYTPEQLVIGVITILIAISQALFPKISFMQWLKTKLPWLRDEIAYWITMVCLFGISALALFVTGYFDPSIVWDLDQVGIFYGILVTISQGAYQRLKASPKQLYP